MATIVEDLELPDIPPPDPDYSDEPSAVYDDDSLLYGPLPPLKIQPERIPSDDCWIYRGRITSGSEVLFKGTQEYPHVGEWVEVLRVDTYQADLNLLKVREGVDSEASFFRLCELLSERVVRWSWRDLGYQVMPQPYKNAQVIRDLDPSEIVWLVDAVKGETDLLKKKVARRSRNTSSAKGQNRSR